MSNPQPFAHATLLPTPPPLPPPIPTPTLNTHHHWNTNVAQTCNRRLHHGILKCDYFYLIAKQSSYLWMSNCLLVLSEGLGNEDKVPCLGDKATHDWKIQTYDISFDNPSPCPPSYDSSTKYHFRILKGRINSGLEGASAIQKFGNLTGKKPCELMHNNHTQIEIKLDWEN